MYTSVACAVTAAFSGDQGHSSHQVLELGDKATQSSFLQQGATHVISVHWLTRLLALLTCASSR